MVRYDNFKDSKLSVSFCLIFTFLFNFQGSESSQLFKQNAPFQPLIIPSPTLLEKLSNESSNFPLFSASKERFKPSKSNLNKIFHQRFPQIEKNENIINCEFGFSFAFFSFIYLINILRFVHSKATRALT